jgi:hypothetical protein
VWVQGASGQLGLGHTRDESVPRQLQGKLSCKRVVHVSCGARHSLAIAADGHLYSWGSNEHGQLGIPLGIADGIRQVTQPTLVATVPRKAILSARACGDHSVAVRAPRPCSMCC